VAAISPATNGQAYNPDDQIASAKQEVLVPRSWARALRRKVHGIALAAEQCDAHREIDQQMKRDRRIGRIRGR